MIGKQLLETLKAMSIRIESDQKDFEWLYTDFDAFRAELKDLQEFAKIDLQRAVAPAPVMLGIPEVAVEEAPAPAPVAAPVVAAVVEEPKVEVTEAPVVEEAVAEPVVEESKVEAKPAAKKAKAVVENNKD